MLQQKRFLSIMRFFCFCFFLYLEKYSILFTSLVLDLCASLFSKCNRWFQQHPLHPHQYSDEKIIFLLGVKYPFKPFLPFHFFSSPLFTFSFKDDTKGKCQLCSIWLHPQDMCQCIQTRTGGAVIPIFYSGLNHNPGKKRSEKMRSALIYPLIPLLISHSRT